LQIADVVATTVSYSDYHIPSLRFNVRHQQVYDTLPSYLKLIYSQKLVTNAPTIAVLKVYGPNYHSEEPEYYVLYYQTGQKTINITVDLTSENYCPLVQMLWHLVEVNETTGKLEWYRPSFLSGYKHVFLVDIFLQDILTILRSTLQQLSSSIIVSAKQNRILIQRSLVFVI
jgi:hypothetical protein